MTDSNRHNVRLEVGKKPTKSQVRAARIVTFWGGRRAQITFPDVIHIRDHIWFGAVIS
jgi:hypothetical protein